jgi:hypothetical protein
VVENVTVHQCPKADSGIMPCCGRTPFEVPSDAITERVGWVTCKGPAPEMVEDRPARETWPARLVWVAGLAAVVLWQFASITAGVLLAVAGAHLWWPVIPTMGLQAGMGIALGVLAIHYALIAFNRVVRTGDE